MREHTPLRDFPVEQEGKSMGELFLKKAFHGKGGIKLFGAFLRGSCSKLGINDEIMLRVGELCKTFSSNLNIVNLNTFPNHKGI